MTLPVWLRRLATTDRARVPFALVGATLLVGALVYAGTLGARGPVDRRDAADTALDRAETTARTAVRVAGRAAVRQTAREPVVVPADTAAGAAVAGDRLRATVAVRTAVGVRRALETTRVGAVSVESGLAEPAAGWNTSRAVDQIGVDPTADGAGVELRVPVVHTARRDGVVITERRDTLRVRLRLPLFAVAERVRRYERRLSRGPLRPGLGRRLGGRVTALAEARGLAQYGGAGIENVVANRHVAVATNGAVLRTQRATFGRADAAGRGALVRAVARTGVDDTLAAAEASAPAASRRREILRGARATHGTQPQLAESGEPTTVVGVNHTADTAYLDAVARVDELTREAYRGRVRRQVDTTRLRRGREPPPHAPGRNWTLVDETTTDRTVITDRDRAKARDRTLLVAERTLQVRHVTVRRWRHDPPEAEQTATTQTDTSGTHTDRTRETRARWSDRYRVRIRDTGVYDPTLPGPARRTDPVFRRGGAHDGRNLAPAATRAVPSPPAVDRIALRAIADGDNTQSRHIRRQTVSGVENWLRRDLARLRERVRNLSVRVDGGALAAGHLTPTDTLLAELADRRGALLAADPPYDGIADRLRVALRARYLRAVTDRLRERRDAAATAGTVRRALVDAVPVSGDQLRAATRAAATDTAPPRRAVVDGPGGAFTLVPDATPSYLTLGPVPGRVDETLSNGTTVTPLAARNVNAVTVPYADAGDTLAGWLTSDTQTTTLGTAGRALAATNRTLGAASLPGDADGTELRADRVRLRRAVAPGVARVERAVRSLLQRRLDISRSDAREVVGVANAGRGLGTRAAVAANGSYATAVAAAAERRHDLSVSARDELAVRLRVELRRVVDERVTVPADPVAAAVDGRRRLVDRVVTEAAAQETERTGQRLRKRLLPEAFGTVLAGLPVAPVPGYWYATANLWYVAVRGEHPSFAVTAQRPGSNRTRLRYTRRNASVQIDVDGDGDDELLGHNRPISFQTETAAVAIVPAGKSGVGDVDGNADERSPGWACPDGVACVSAADGGNTTVSVNGTAAVTSEQDGRAERTGQSASTSSDEPVISVGGSIPSSDNSVGATSGRLPPSRTAIPPSSPPGVSETNGTGSNVCAVCGSSAVPMSSAFPWSAVTSA